MTQAAKRASRRARQAATARKAKSSAKPGAKLGALPEWNLNDLYPGLESPELKWDLENVETRCVEFEADYKGKLAALAAQPSAPGLVEAVKRYEGINYVLGRLGSYSGLLHATDSTNPTYTKFYGDISERITTAYSPLLFFDLELTRIDDAALDAAMRDGPLGHYRPWIEDVRKEKPYQLDDRIEQLFHEKSLTGYSAWNRQYDDIVASLRF